MELPSAERISVARELHDGIAQDLVGIGYSLDLLLADGSLNNSTRNQIRTSRLQVDGLISKVRSEIFRLREPENSSFISQLGDLIAEQRFATIITFSHDDVDLPQEHIPELILIASEILRNIESHAGATRVVIDLYPINNRTCLEISDNGIGGAHMKDGHYGIHGIVERVESLGGSITIENLEGTRIAILV